MFLNKKGFTLVEILVTVLILSFLISAIYRVLNIGQLTYYTDMGLLDLHQNVRMAMSWMTRELRESSPDEVLVSQGNRRITFDTPNEDNIQYYCDTNDVNRDGIRDQVIREYPSGNYRIIANNISSLTFSFNNAIVDIDIVASVTAFNRNLSFPLKSRAYLRNEEEGSGSSDDTSGLANPDVMDDSDDVTEADDDSDFHLPLKNP